MVCILNKDYYAFHIFYDNAAAKKECEGFLESHFDIINFSKIPTKKIPQITDEPLIWRYFVTPLPTKLAASQLDEREFVVHNGEISSYDANRRDIEMYGYKCMLQTDTEVIAYMVDYLHRRKS